MNRETNIGSLVAFDKQIAEKTEEIIQLKRSRNSVLNIARIPPEILGCIFYLSTVPALPFDHDDMFAGIQKGSYKFLLVCHHWFEVACHTPELWSSWGTRLEEWGRHCLRPGPSPLDLVLDWEEAESLNETVRNALVNRAARGLVRKVHLRSRDMGFLTSILSSVTPEEEGVRPCNIESIILTSLDVSNFFTRHSFPKLRHLSLSGCPDTVWDHLKSHTRAIVRLSLCDDVTSSTPTPTTSQILSLLASNPDIRTLTLRLRASDGDSRCDPSYRVSLPRLERFSLAGSIHRVFPILQRLEFPGMVSFAELMLNDSTLEVTRQVVGPYIRDYLKRDTRFGDRLALFVSSSPGHVSIGASVPGDVGEYHFDRSMYATFGVELPPHATKLERDKLCIDVLALLPQEPVVCLETDISTGVMEELLIAMPNIEILRLYGAVMFEWFLLPDPDGPNAHKKLLPSLQRLSLEDLRNEDDDWDPLVRYLTHQTSGGQSVSLRLTGPHVCSGTLEQIKDLVEDLVYHPDPIIKCPFDDCSD